jgi:hypothetical protein
LKKSEIENDKSKYHPGLPVCVLVDLWQALKNKNAIMLKERTACFMFKIV